MKILDNHNLEHYTKHELDNHTFRNVLKNVFYNNWKERNNFYSLEIIFSPKCNQGCSYCYLNKDNRHIYSCQDFKEKESIENVVTLLSWLKEMDVAPPQIDIFSGELFAQKAGYDLLEAILNFYDENPTAKKPELYVIPTNGTFVMDDALTQKVLNYIERFKEKDIQLALSFSIDGYHASKITRKYKKNLDYDLSSSYDNKEFYEKAFKFMADTNNLPHPMISPENISVWKENFLWYEKMMEKYNIPLESLFLLEVRNANWTTEKLELYKDFIIFVMKHMREKYKNDDEFLTWMVEYTSPGKCMGFNFLSSIFHSDEPNPSCTIGRQLMVRAMDLKVFPCHRLMYPEFEIGQYISDKEKVLEFDTKAPELGISILSFNPKQQNVCSRCILKNMCINQCFGSCYETIGEMFTPIPSVCNLLYLKTKTILNTLKEMKLVNKLFDHIHSDVVVKSVVSFLNKEIGEMEK